MSEITVGARVYRKELRGGAGTVLELFDAWGGGPRHARVRWDHGNPSAVQLCRLVLVTPEAGAQKRRVYLKDRRKHLTEDLEGARRFLALEEARGNEERAAHQRWRIERLTEQLQAIEAETEQATANR